MNQGAKSDRMSLHIIRKKRIITTLPESLARRADKAAKRLHTSRAELIREALEAHVQKIERAELEREIAESLKANADLDAAILKDYAGFDADTWDPR